MLNESLGLFQESKNIRLEVTGRFKETLTEVGFDPLYGARPLRRAIMIILEETLAQALLSNKLISGDHTLIDVDLRGDVNILLGLAKLNVSDTLPRKKIFSEEGDFGPTLTTSR
jgi:ATP-dependent Clp protease ATP-binding subunit ClpC